MAAFVGTTTVVGQAVTIDRTPVTVIISPVAGASWAAINGCCAPNIHRNVRVGAGTHIARPEFFTIVGPDDSAKGLWGRRQSPGPWSGYAPRGEMVGVARTR